jgi:MoaA/NifB/PqqE/SkfB family radical SAM enzyme
MEKTPELSTEGVFKILDNIAKSSIIVLSIEGGDPLMRKDLLDVLEYAHTKPFYLFFTTNGRLIDYKPMNEFCKYIDFLHISIDEGHKNLNFLESLEEFKEFGVPICVQIVVTKDSLDTLESKVKIIHKARVRTVIMPATHLENTENFYPDPKNFNDVVCRLKRKYKNTITTSNGFLNNIKKTHGCSTSSIIIDTDGGLFYPCRIVGKKAYNLTEGSLLEFLKSKTAQELREKMNLCKERCGWYQYFATDSFASPISFLSSSKPYLREKFI